MSGFPYKSPPMDHQRDTLRQMSRHREYALFWEMGTGKTFTTINLAAGRFMKGHINALVVICPTPIKLVWENEIEKWAPCDVEVHTVHASKKNHENLIYFTTKETDAMKVVIVGVEALSQGKAAGLVLNFAKLNKCMAVADESSRLKNFNTNRTKKAAKIAHASLYRLILTGTPITQGVEDLFGQFYFLNPRIIGLSSFVLFRRRYCIMGGFDDKKIVDYMNVDELMRKVSTYVSIIKKEQVLDLPDKIYERVAVDLAPNQLKLITELKDQFYAEHSDETLTTETVLERLTRFQQICGGNFPYDEDEGSYGVKPIDGPNPKIQALAEILEDLPWGTKVIIWARFRPEMALIETLISEKFGKEAVVTFHGGNSHEERKKNVQDFQFGKARFMISNPALGGMGQTWTAATAVIYYSNSFSFEDRMQSEDRAHRKGQENKVTYIDIEVNHPYDTMILKAIKHKGGLAKFVDQQISHQQAIL